MDDFDINSHFAWETDYFKQFEWLDKNKSKEETENREMEEIKNKEMEKRIQLRSLLLPLIYQLGVNINAEPNPQVDASQNKLYMYFISLEEDKMFLYTDFKEENDQIIAKTEQQFEFVQIYKPRKIVLTIEITDFYDIDKYVKQFMHMFGIDNTRGGSYCNTILDIHTLEFIENEKEITCLEHYTSPSSV